ncbi:MAG: phosphoenolpyruvate--protein phosphotransferase [Deltaproteobacteria bacterium]|nr:phosphoenolpyruvate--protein phosphotransferase [Deltaproteobacteria bacterium]
MTKATESTETTLNGINASPGICIGKAYLVDPESVSVVKKYTIEPKLVKKEIRRFKTAVTSARKELKAIIAKIPEELRDQTYILEAHLLLHKDKMLYEKSIRLIDEERINAEWALKTSIGSVKERFDRIPDPYLKSRAADIEHVSERIMRQLTGATDVDLTVIDKRVILVAHNLSPAETSQIQVNRVMGFVTDRGGKASHTSIIARTLEIPAVLGLGNATTMIQNDDLIIVDGSEGIVIVNPDEKTLIRYEELNRRYESYKADILRISEAPAVSTDGRHFKIMGNIELPEEVVGVRDHGGDGIGLFRTEFLYLSRNNFPEETELFNQYREIVELMAPGPVTIRTLDINGDKEISSLPALQEANPALGLRAIRFCLKKPKIFKTQIRAILRAAAFGNVRLLLPMISGCEEIQQSKRIIEQAAASLEKDGLPHKADIEIGAMIEIPSAAIMADELAKIVDFLSIGTNDLVQYALAIDRGNRFVAYLYNPLHPAVIRMIAQTVDGAKKNGKKIFMCGEMAADPINIPFLMALGIDELSMSPQSIPEVKNLIRKIDSREAEKLLPGILSATSASEIQNLIIERYGDILKESLSD